MVRHAPARWLALAAVLAIGACGEDDRPASFEYIHTAILAPSCATASCHTEAVSQAGIRLHTVAPGLIDTPIYDAFPDPDEFKANLGQNVLFPKRLGTAEDFASLALELVRNHYLNGEVIRMDAGIRMPPK